VSVNGKTVRELGTRARVDRDRICVDGRRVRTQGRRVHYVLYKPRGVVSTTRDPHAKRTVLDLVPRRERLFPVGRLDAASEGLLLLTNDGPLAQLLLHPSYRIPRTYKVSVDGAVKGASLKRLARGIELDGRRTAPCEVELIEQTPERSVLEMTLIEGRQRQIREMMKAIGHPVRRLLRVRFGPLRLRGLRPGEWRTLDAREVAALDRMRRQLTELGQAAPRRQNRG
jgi:pseudouridine synthase